MPMGMGLTINKPLDVDNGWMNTLNVWIVNGVSHSSIEAITHSACMNKLNGDKTIPNTCGQYLLSEIASGDS